MRDRNENENENGSDKQQFKIKNNELATETNTHLPRTRLRQVGHDIYLLRRCEGSNHFAYLEDSLFSSVSLFGSYANSLCRGVMSEDGTEGWVRG